MFHARANLSNFDKDNKEKKKMEIREQMHVALFFCTRSADTRFSFKKLERASSLRSFLIFLYSFLDRFLTSEIWEHAGDEGSM